MAVSAEWLEKDYYGLLGMPETATPQEITRAYRRLARALHPDTNPDAGDGRRFAEVAAAYEVLGDAGKRREYDEVRRAARARRAAGAGARGWPHGHTVRVRRRGAGPSESVDDLFGGSFAARPRAARPRRGPDVVTDLHLGFEEAVRGTTQEIPVVDEVSCPACAGLGARPGTAAPCPACAGSGVQRRTRTVAARVPAGVEDGQTIRLEGRGGPGRDGGPAGDLRVRVHVAPHRLFGRQGDDLTVTLPVTFAEAALGADVRVPTLDQPVTLRIPPGTQTGTTFRVRGRGVPARAGPGDLLVTVHVEVPRHLTDDQRAAVEALAAATPGSPRSRLGV